jgi:WD40 repeat protein
VKPFYFHVWAAMKSMPRDLTVGLCVFVATLLISLSAFGQDESKPADPVSFAKDVRPILAANCFGCHQGSLDRGGYVMTDFDSLMAGGDSGDPAVVPGDPASSPLIDLVTPHDGEAKMPPSAEPLSEEQLVMLSTWISAGAKNDYTRPVVNFNASNPPVYSRLPVVNAIDISPDGNLIAVSGFHEVILIRSPVATEWANNTGSSEPVTGKIVGRLIGLSSRIESLGFSPDGTRLAVSGGNPGEFGEVQIWNVEKAKLELSKTVSFDTVYGVDWSPDGKYVSFGCTDTTVRVIDSETGEQVLFQGAHEDWIRDTVFSVDGSRLVSVGRDMSCKLIEVETQRFVDNVTSITPGVLKGGIASIARHPQRDEIVIGGADGVAKVYRLDRLTKRKIGDDANLIRQMPKMPGRINSVAVSSDGRRIVAGSSFNGNGDVRIYSYEFDPGMPDEIKAIVTKVVNGQSKQEKEQLAAYLTQDVKVIASAKFTDNAIYSVAFHPDGKSIVVGGTDGLIRVVDSESGKLRGAIAPVEVSDVEQESAAVAWQFPEQVNLESTPPLAGTESPLERKLVSLSVSPQEIGLSNPTDYVQFVVQAKFEDGSFEDVTHQSTFRAGDEVLLEQGFVQFGGAGKTEIEVAYGGISERVPATVNVAPAKFVPDFIHDVNPVLTKLGCSAGTCHGSQGGKKGFKLSLRGYDPLYDIRSFTDDMGARRVNLAAPETSMMLLKPLADIPHEGGKLIERGDKYYSLIHEWIKGGAHLDLSQPKVTSVELFPKNPVLANQDSTHQMRVVANYADGSSQDVTRESVIEVGNLEVAKVAGSVVTALRRGESPVLARYEGAFTATTITVMGERESFVWKQPESWGPIDDLVASKWKRMKITPSGLCSDDEFLRRVYLDLTGLPPTASQVDAFLDDSREPRIKRDEMVDQLIGNQEFVTHWANKWADLMQVNRKYLGPEGAKGLRDWIKTQVNQNRPYNEFAYEVLTASGSNRENPAAAYYKIHRTPEEAMENTTHLFLATRFNCNKCHDHPFERWTQDQYYETAAFFAQVELKKDPASGDKRIGGSAVEGAKPLYEIVADAQTGDVLHERTGQVADPKFPFDCDFDEPDSSTRRERLASWITSSDNPYFATSHVNRLWGYMTGVGLVEPLDDIRAGNPASNPQLIEYLRKEFVQHGFDSRHVIRMICKSRTYQLSIATNEFNADDTINYSHAMARRLPAEVLFDSVHAVTGSQFKIPGVPAGTRAAELPDSGVKLPSGFLATLGRPARESACECERANDLQLGSVLALVSGPDVANAINDPQGKLTELVIAETDDRKLVDKIFMRVLSRHATDQEIAVAQTSFAEIADDHRALLGQRDVRKVQVADRLPELESGRQAVIDDVTMELEAKIREIDPTLADRELKRSSGITSAKNSLDAYQANQSGNLQRWQTRQLNHNQWHPVLFSKFESKNMTPYTIRADHSVLLEPKTGKDTYIAIGPTELTGATAVRLELLHDPSLPGSGPGLAENGNLVLTEFEMFAAHPDRPDDWQKLDLTTPRANVSQNGFSIDQIINGKSTNNKGWALVNAVGKTSWATFQLKLPEGYSDGTLVKFKLHQQFDDKHQIGCFRISLSRFQEPVGLGLSEALLAELSELKVGVDEKADAKFLELANQDDLELKRLQASVMQVEKPLIIEPAIVKLREKLVRVSKPIPADVLLIQLEKDVVISATQLENSRLTAAQDLTWALINSPSFLFNR